MDGTGRAGRLVAFGSGVTLCPPKLLKTLGLPIICAAMFVVMGGHWALLQGVAWSQMVVSYSRDAGSLSAGLEKTFSGQYPCSMCKKIAAHTQREEQKQAVFKADKKVESFVAEARTVTLPPVGEKFSYPVVADSRFTVRAERPPTPVPIVA